MTSPRNPPPLPERKEGEENQSIWFVKNGTHVEMTDEPAYATIDDVRNEFDLAGARFEPGSIRTANIVADNFGFGDGVLTITREGEFILGPKATPQDAALAIKEAWDRMMGK